MKARISLGNITGLGLVDFSGLGPDFPGPWIIQLLNQCLPRARQTETVQKLSLELDLLTRRLAVPPEAMAVPPGSPVVLVTGSSHGGIGYSLCEQFAAKGCTVYASARRLEAISSLTHPSIRPLIMDVTSDTSVRKAVGQVIEETGRLDIVVANAEIGCFGPVLDVSIEYAKQALDTNVLFKIGSASIPVHGCEKEGDIPYYWFSFRLYPDTMGGRIRSDESGCACYYRDVTNGSQSAESGYQSHASYYKGG